MLWAWKWFTIYCLGKYDFSSYSIAITNIITSTHRRLNEKCLLLGLRCWCYLQLLVLFEGGRHLWCPVGVPRVGTSEDLPSPQPLPSLSSKSVWNWSIACKTLSQWSAVLPKHMCPSSKLLRSGVKTDLPSHETDQHISEIDLVSFLVGCHDVSFAFHFIVINLFEFGDMVKFLG